MGLLVAAAFAYARTEMPPTMRWLAWVVRLAVVPVCLGALFLVRGPQPTARDVAVAAGLVVLVAVHLLYWWRPWPSGHGRAVAAAAAMVLTNVLLIHVLDLSQPLLWLYPALIVGAGFPPPIAAAGVGLLALAAGPLTGERLLTQGHAEVVSSGLVPMLGPGHAIVLAVALAGLGMTAVRQLVAVNADLRATKAELADLAVTAERARLARELHDLLGRTLSLIAVKAELAGRLSARGDTSASAELADVQRLAREAVREVREAVSGGHAPSVQAELAAAEWALRTAGIAVSVDGAASELDPAHEAAVAWVLREAVTNVVKHSGARTCRIALAAAEGATTVEVVDDGRGPVSDEAGVGLAGLADRVHAVGGTFEAGPGGDGGFRIRARLGTAAARSAAALAR